MGKTRPIIFTTESVKAILDGRKTMTRRVVKDPRRSSRERDAFLATAIGKPSIGDIQAEAAMDLKPNFACPYGQVGDRLWVRETHYKYGYWYQDYLNRLTRTGRQRWSFMPVNKDVKYIDNPPDDFLTGISDKVGWYKRPSMFMFHFDSRITLEITGIRVERLQEISASDCAEEGLQRTGDIIVGGKDMKGRFKILWDSLNAKRGYGWDKNPWVWVIRFDNIGVRVK